MAHRFNVIMSARVELNDEIDANTEAEAREEAELRLRAGIGTDISEIVVERNMMLDEEIDTELLRFADVHSRLPNA